MYMAYNQRSSIKISGMESQHTTLKELLDTMRESVEKGKSREAQNRIVADFLDYMGYHFQKEGELIKTYGYPDYLVEYENDQEALKKEMNGIRERLRNSTFVLDDQTILILNSFVRRHILSSEKYLVRRTEGV